MGQLMKGNPLAALLMAGGQLGGSLFAPEGQELQSFSGPGNEEIHPAALMGRTKDIMEGALEALFTQLAEPATVKTTVPSMPSFVGGGLPMPIGGFAQDPGIYDPSRLSKPGVQLRRLSPSSGSGGGGESQPVSGPRGGDLASALELLTSATSGSGESDQYEATHRGEPLGPGEPYLTPEEARAAGVPWRPRG